MIRISLVKLYHILFRYIDVYVSMEQAKITH